ncbi:MAG: Gfo/Idh/MocA family oxidoreductase [Oscillospiraceae bacterium]|nr:Gfo/Idh/MocA family oxidoreductase [Oscillospiraceae bacterium]
MINVVLAGWGGYGKFYADYLIQNPHRLDYTFRAVADPFLREEDKAALAVLNIPYFDSLEAFYKTGTAELAIISAPIHLHKPMCETAVKNGSAVLCEKPAAARLCELLEMHEYETRYQKDIFIGFQWSFADPILNLKRDLLRGAYGRVLSGKAIVLWNRDLSYYNRSTGWAGKRQSKDGAYVYDSVASNAAAHYLNNLLFLLGDRMDAAAEAAEIQADCRKANPIETFDTCVIKARTAKGQPLLFIASHAADRNIDPIFEIVCEKAVISCDFSKDNGLLTARLPDGTSKQYGALNTSEQEQQKIVRTVNWLNGAPGAEKPVSTVMATRPFASVIDYIFETAEFKPFDQEVVFDQAANRYYVPKLSDTLMDIYNKHESGRS